MQVAVDTARKLQDELDASSSLEPLEMDSSASCEKLEASQNAVQALENYGQKLNFSVVEKLIQPENLPETLSFISECDDWQKKHSELQQKFNAELDASLVQVLKDAIEHCSSNKISSLNLTQLRRELSEEKSKVDSFKLRERELSEFVKCFPESSVWRLDTFNSLADLVASVPAKALGKRKELFNDSSVVETAEQLCNAGTQLKQQRSQIENIISVPQSISSEKLRLYLKQFQNQSLLSLFNSEFKEAKKFYVAASKRHRFEKESAIKDLMELIDWKEQEEKFLANKNGMEIFGSTFDLETDFDLMKDLFAYYKKIDESYSGITNKDVRKFLKTAEKDVLLAIPQVEAIDSHFNYTELHKHIADAEQKISSKQANLETLESLLVVVKDLASYDIPGLLQLAKSVDGHFKTQKNLDANEKSREVLGECFAGARTRGEKIVGELKVAESLIPVADKYELLVRLFEADKCAALVEVLASYRKLRAESLAAQENFQQKTGLNVFKELSSLEEKCSSLSKAALDKDGLYLNSRLFGSIKRLDDYRLGWVVDELLNSHDSLQGLDKTIEAVVRRAMAKYMYSQKRDVLSRFNGTRLDEFRKRLKTLDQEILRLSRKSLRYKLQRNAHPPRGIGFGKKSEYTNMALLENELAKKKRFVPVRDLTRRAGTALLELKPCWMMSPLAVAQYIRKDDVYFDLVIIDEASQMPPEDALGALLRAQQALVVGDTNQLPPTAFFRKMMDDDDKDEDETVLDESILELANAAFRPSRRLRWHYRSRHSSLIAFSNHMVYNDDLVVFPAAEEQRADMGVSLVHVDGLYKSGANGDEAKVMIDAAINFMKTYPDRSLGLVTLNQKQRDLLQEEMDFALSKDSKAQAYIDYWKQEKDGLESFFIKNLENVQGDERDVIFIGTVYGRESHGAEVMQRFGPINGLAGKRRLNVLFSRAKKQIVTFSSMTSTDIKADEMLKKWLEYSASGIIQSGVKTARSTDSDFEDFVIAQIRSMGFQAEPQVGVAGYFIDIGVKHPDWGYGYILGVECDGAIYHSSKSARDRDRLRQEVLEGLGWNLHRIWSTDWFNDPKGQADKLRTILESRLQELRIRDKKMQRSEFASASSNVDSGSKIVQLSLLPDEVADDEDDDPDELTDSADDYSPAELTDSRRVYEVTRAEIDDAILAILKSCPNNSCTVKSMHTRVLKELKIITRGNPRIQFQKRVKTCIDNLVHKGVIEKYQSKNERVRLVT